MSRIETLTDVMHFINVLVTNFNQPNLVAYANCCKKKNKDCNVDCNALVNTITEKVNNIRKESYNLQLLSKQYYLSNPNKQIMQQSQPEQSMHQIKSDAQIIYDTYNKIERFPTDHLSKFAENNDFFQAYRNLQLMDVNKIFAPIKNKAATLVGGDHFKQKYYKYKLKYLALKQQL